jgi:hypothetical protein
MLSVQALSRAIQVSTWARFYTKGDSSPKPKLALIKAPKAVLTILISSVFSTVVYRDVVVDSG